MMLFDVVLIIGIHHNHSAVRLVVIPMTRMMPSIFCSGQEIHHNLTLGSQPSSVSVGIPLLQSSVVIVMIGAGA
eukprot:scaffold421402_cov48-Attheya_sp.AAC.2